MLEFKYLIYSSLLFSTDREFEIFRKRDDNTYEVQYNCECELYSRVASNYRFNDARYETPSEYFSNISQSNELVFACNDIEIYKNNEKKLLKDVEEFKNLYPEYFI